jgi:LmbE family N-acetylglucosaminyl deacetylase
MSILVVAAHPDDEVLGCGGVIARKDVPVHILILGEGITSRYDDPAEAKKEDIEKLHSQAKEVSKFLGAQEVEMANLPDNRFDTVALLDVVKIIEKKIQDVQPTTIYTHHGGDLNIDHVVTFRAVLTATRPPSVVKNIYAFEVPSSTEYAFQKFSPFHPNVFENIEGTLEEKIKAMEIYESEARKFPHPRSPEALRAIAKKWGSVCGHPAAEAFELIRSI